MLLRYLEEAGRLDEVIELIGEWLRRDPDDSCAAAWAGSLAAEGRSEALELVLSSIDAEGTTSAARFVESLLERRSVDTALTEPILRALVRDKVGRDFGHRWIDLLLESGRKVEALSALTVLVDAGDGWMAVRLAQQLAESGDVAAAAAMLADRHIEGGAVSGWPLFEQLVEAGRHDDAIRLMHAVVGNQNITADARSNITSELAKLLIELDRLDELRELATVDHSRTAAWQLYRALADRGRFDELEAPAYEEDDQLAASLMLDHLYELGRTEDAERLLRARAVAGDSWAADRLAGLQVALMPLDHLRQRARQGQRHAAERLVRILVANGAADQHQLWDEVEAGVPGADDAFVKLLANRGHRAMATNLLAHGREPGETVKPPS